MTAEEGASHKGMVAETQPFPVDVKRLAGEAGKRQGLKLNRRSVGGY